MLREGANRPARQSPLSDEARLLLLLDHHRGLHNIPVDDCDPCSSAPGTDVPADGMEACNI